MKDFFRSLGSLCFYALLAAVLFLVAIPAHAGVLYVPNFSFETPVTDIVGTNIDSWEDLPEQAYYESGDFGTNSWNTLMGLFSNTSPTNDDHLENLDGNQAAYIFNLPGAGFFQDFNSLSGTNPVPSHAFNTKFEVGRSYHLTAGITSSFDAPLTPGASLEMSLYYYDASNNPVTVAATNIIFDTNVFTNINRFLDFTIDVPTVTTNGGLAGQNIGIQFVSSTEDPDLFGGVWDLDNVRLTSTIAVPNFSFETPSTTNADPSIDSWEDESPSPFYDPSQGPWDNLMGEFLNPEPGSFDHLNNIDGTQAAYIFTFTGAGFFQDFDSIDWSNTVPNHAFNVTLDPGKSYTLTTAITSSTDEPLTNGDAIQMSLYYYDASNNLVTLAANNILFDTNVFTNLDDFLDFSATIPIVKPTDPWAGQPLGIQFISTTPLDPALFVGVWDLDNVRLTEKVATAFSNPVVTNGQVSFTLHSEPNLAFEILSATNLTASPANWNSVVTFTNLTGSFAFTDTVTNQQRFYKAHQLP